MGLEDSDPASELKKDLGCGLPGLPKDVPSVIFTHFSLFMETVIKDWGGEGGGEMQLSVANLPKSNHFF